MAQKANGTLAIFQRKLEFKPCLRSQVEMSFGGLSSAPICAHQKTTAPVGRNRCYWQTLLKSCLELRWQQQGILQLRTEIYWQSSRAAPKTAPEHGWRKPALLFCTALPIKKKKPKHKFTCKLERNSFNTCKKYERKN